MTDLRVCFLGDSFTLGQGDAEMLGWTGRLCARTAAAGYDITGYNLGVRRETGAEIADRAEAETSARFRYGDRKAVFVSFGANDVHQGRPQAESLAALSTMLELAKRRGYDAFVLSPPPLPGLEEATASLTAAMARVAEEAGSPFLDITKAGVDWQVWARETQAGDGIHPGTGAYDSLSRAVERWDGWRMWLAASR